MNKLVYIDEEPFEFVPVKKNGYSLQSLNRKPKMSALTRKEKDQRNGSKARRKPLTPAKSMARVTGIAKILALMSRATKGRVRSDPNTVMQTVLARGL